MAISALSTIPSIHLQPQLILQLASWAAVASFNVNVGFTLEGLSVYPTVRDKTCFTHIHTHGQVAGATCHMASGPPPGGGVGGLSRQGGERFMLQCENQSSATQTQGSSDDKI